MGGCSIRKCQSRCVKGGTTMFFSFPKKESVANEWLRYCRTKTARRTGRVCSKHFTNSDYITPLSQILLGKCSSRRKRLLRPDAIPTLQIDNIDIQNTLHMSVNGETVHNPNNVNHISQKNKMPVGEVARSSKVVEESDETISFPVAEDGSLKIEDTDVSHALKNATSDNKNYLLQSNMVSANVVAGCSKVFEKSEETISVSVANNNKILTVNEFRDLKYGTSDNKQAASCLSRSNIVLVPANVVAGCSKVVEKSGETISGPEADNESMKILTANEFRSLKNGTSDNKQAASSLSQSNIFIVPANVVAGCPKVVKKSEETFSDPEAHIKAIKILTVNEFRALKYGASDNKQPASSLSQSNTVPVPAKVVAGCSKVVEKSNETVSFSEAEDGKITAIDELRCEALKNGTTDNRNSLPPRNTVPVPANVVAGCSTVVNCKSNKYMCDLNEYESLKRTANEYHTLKNNLEKIFTPGQIRCLKARNRRRIKWCAEDIAAAIKLKNISQKAYRHLRLSVGIPLPAFSTLRKWVDKQNSIEEQKEDQNVKEDSLIQEDSENCSVVK